MKLYILPALAALFLSAAVLCTGCGSSAAPASPEQPAEPGPPVCGGTDDNTDYNAPKTVSSTAITSFSCYTWVRELLQDGGPVLAAPWYRFTAEKDGDRVNCTRSTAGAEVSFTADAAFLDALQAIVARYDLPQYNGISLFTNGLPEDFGATVKIRYESGETVYASDNQGNFLPPDASAALLRLFCGYGRDWLTITGEEAQAIMDSNGYVTIVDVRRADEFAAGHIPYAVNVPNEDIQAATQLDGLLSDDYPVLLYCRSGRRSAEAAEKLTTLGARNIYDFGGIIDWTGEVVTD